ncbi:MULTISPECIES: 4'-phosphopantetheinyl transferase family protein [Bacillus cereus group]|uniref:4'-phosphopantetheinyl transferase family protein n=1 Tax=Bacillus cereus group TaxID=86661 RepID=UPI0009B560DE
MLCFRKQKDALRSLLGDLLIRSIICEEFNISNSNIHFKFNEFGKPYLYNKPSFHFNISHSGEWVVCAIDHHAPVGIDIEQIKPIDFEIAKCFFSDDEYKHLLLQPTEKQLDYFYTLWTLKESFIKAHGEGFFMPFNTFSFFIMNNEISIDSVYKSNPYKYFNQLHIHSDYKLSITTAHKNLHKRILVKNINEIKTAIKR